MIDTQPHDQPRIVLVDDDDGDRRLFRRMFKKHYPDVVIDDLPDGQALLDYLRQPRVTNAAILVLLDINMPGLDGFDVLTVLKSDLNLRLIPVVIYSTSGNENDITKAYQLGANSYIKKPASLDALLDSVRSINHYWLTVARYSHQAIANSASH